MPVKDITGMKFGRWLVINREQNSERGLARWKVRCECGNESIVFGFSLRSGESKSCGCLNRELASKRQKDNPTYKQTHGMSNTDFYKSWSGMLRRCDHDKSYKGQIFVCNRWRTFETFKQDMYDSYLEHVMVYGENNTSLDRINGYKGYCPYNCRWVTLKEQFSHQQRKKIRNKAGV